MCLAYQGSDVSNTATLDGTEVTSSKDETSEKETPDITTSEDEENNTENTTLPEDFTLPDGTNILETKDDDGNTIYVTKEGETVEPEKVKEILDKIEKETKVEETKSEKETKPIKTEAATEVQTKAPVVKPTEAPTEKVPSLVKITAAVNGSNFKVGDTLSTANIIVTAYFDNGAVIPGVEGWVANTLKLTSTTNTIAIAFADKTCTLTVNAQAVVKPTEAPTKAPAVKPTEAPTKAPATDPKASWKKITFSDDFDTFTVYSNGVWAFDLMEASVANDTEQEFYLGKGLNSGICVYAYLGNETNVTIPNDINGYPVKIARYPFQHNTTVKKVTILNNMEQLWGLCYESVITDVIVKEGSKATKYASWSKDCNFWTNDPKNYVTVYCEKAVADNIESWYETQCVAKSFDGKTIYYQSSPSNI